MTPLSTHVDNARSQVNDAVHKASPFVRKFARFGYAAKGVVYVIVGGLAAAAAFGRGGQTTGSRGALQAVFEQPFGQVLLGIVAFGLGCYAAWQFIRAVEDPENEGSDAKAVAKRVGFFISGVIHVGLVIAAVRMIVGSGSGGGGDGSGDGGAQGWTATLMSYPLGQWLVAIVGLIIAGYGIWQLIRAYKADLDSQLVISDMSAAARQWIRRVCRFGMAARGVVFGIIGLFLVLAAWRENPSEARGLGGALRSLQEQEYGPWLLGVVALGLIAYGVYEFVRARYRRIEAR
ncbi:MAG TPA: DUF1206 domain-containing protein [Tepidisphaeraceae bacterium]|nr:DUF1206 domain-containing protein [Tepidisphaeraceae bacterium]